MEREETQRVKIAFRLENIVETMWASVLNDGTYEIDNSPFEAYEISYQDVVAAHMQDGRLVFDRVVRRGGHSTYRVKLNSGAEHDVFLKSWQG